MAAIADGVQEAQKAILKAVRADPDRQWEPHDFVEALKDLGISDTLISIAFTNLVENGSLVVDSEFLVTLAPKR